MANAAAVQRGLEIIIRREPGAQVSASSVKKQEQLLCGNVKQTLPNLQEDELIELKRLGWQVNEQQKSFVFPL